MKRLKLDIHNHILPETWPDLKEVSFSYARYTFTGYFTYSTCTLTLFRILWRRTVVRLDREHLMASMGP